MTEKHICSTCKASWLEDDLVEPGKIINAVCQECGYDSRIHGEVGMVFTLDEYGEPQ